MNQEYNELTQQRVSLSEFYAKVYAILGVGVLISALTAYLTTEYFMMSLRAILGSIPFGFAILWVIQIGLVFFLSAKAMKNPTASMIGFIAYSFLNGITLSFTLAQYGVETMGQAFFAAAATFGAMAVVGKKTKTDLSPMGRAMHIALIGIIISIIVNIFLKSSAFDFFISILTVLVFSGLTAYDHQMIGRYYEQAKNDEKTLAGMAIFCALQLYLDFINLLLAFARIFARD